MVSIVEKCAHRKYIMWVLFRIVWGYPYDIVLWINENSRKKDIQHLDYTEHS